MSHARECNEYAKNHRDELEQIAEATRLSLQISDPSAQSPSVSPAKEPLLSRRSQNRLAELLGSNSTSEPKPKNAEGSNEMAASEAIFRTSCSSFQSENDLEVPATVPKSESWAGRCLNKASSSFGSSASTDFVVQCSFCAEPQKSHRFVCLSDHGHGDTDQVFCKNCITFCSPGHVQLLVRNSRPLTSEERGRFYFLNSNNCTDKVSVFDIYFYKILYHCW